MLVPLTDLPEGVIGFEGKGKLHSDDYISTLLPAVEAAAKAGGVRVVLVFDEWDGLSAGAYWEDLKMGVEHLTGWKRIALVTDIEWMQHLTAMFGWMTPGAMKHFSVADRADAIAWAAADD
ncbi:STAS/SEC14 domain-containing protein [Aquihabitans sp. McL0605]|uniref:STAS/SEC14 domain-containing protein n=1 Tax=Aquihabitans sp. McL0605 TaxID=3415671 RepID=UPI003CF0E4B4